MREHSPRTAAANGRFGDDDDDDNDNDDDDDDDGGGGPEDGYYPRDAAKEELGNLLFRDELLSGNMDIYGARHSGIAAASELAPRSLSDQQVADLIDFLHALTASLDLRSTIPMEVPSGLPVFD